MSKNKQAENKGIAPKLSKNEQKLSGIASGASQKDVDDKAVEDWPAGPEYVEGEGFPVGASVPTLSEAVKGGTITVTVATDEGTAFVDIPLSAVVLAMQGKG